VGEAGIPVHAGAERLVLGLPAPAERIVLEGGSLLPGDGLAGIVEERHRADDDIGAVAGDPHLGLAVLVDDLAIFVHRTPQTQAERPDGQLRTTRMMSSTRPPLGVTNG